MRSHAKTCSPTVNSFKIQSLQALRSWSVTSLLVSAAMLYSGALLAEPIPVLHMQGTIRGFLALRKHGGQNARLR